MKPYEQQKDITDKIEEAKIALSEACMLACDLPGWRDQWQDIGDTMDAVTALWWRIHEAPQPATRADCMRS